MKCLASLLLLAVMAFTANLFLSCTSQPASTEPGDFLWLEGTWALTDDINQESWFAITPDSLVGFGYVDTSGQPVITEKLILVRNGAAFMYRATVINHNQGTSIPFTGVEITDSSFFTENQGHTYPKIIRYQLLNDGRLLTAIGNDPDSLYEMYWEKALHETTYEQMTSLWHGNR